MMMALVYGRERPKRVRLLTLVALFASIHGLLASIPGAWGPADVARSFVIFIESIEGIVLGPSAGFTSASIGCVLGRILRPREEGFLLSVAFGMGEAIASLVAGLMFRKKFWLVTVVYLTMLIVLLTNPLTWSAHLPLWALWDTFLALLAILPAHLVVKKALANRERSKWIGAAVGMTTFVSTEADMLFRIFLLIPLRFYILYPIPVELLPAIFAVGALVTPVEALLSTVAATILSIPLLSAIDKSKLIDWPAT